MGNSFLLIILSLHLGDYPGDYILEASTFLDAGNVDIEFYDDTAENLLFSSKEGVSETIPFTVHQGGDFYIKYLMPVCINPWGACAVEINVSRVK